MDSIHSVDPPTREAPPEDRVQGTVIDFGEFKVRQNRLGGQTILEFVGTATPNLGQEMERLAGRARADVGLDLSELEGFTPALLPSLERIRKRFASLRRRLFICNPPSKLLDALTLAGVAGLYPIAQASGTLPGSPFESPAEEAGRGPDRASPAASGREIARFDHSLKRTEKLVKDLDSAERCVQKILPREAPSLPGYRFAFLYRQSEIVGGDFFDFIPLADGMLGISIGDVAGKGLEAAILMCLAKKVISIRAQDPAGPPARPGEEGPCPSPREVLSRANQDLLSDLDRSTFITAIYAVLEPRRGVLRFARAGHEKPVRFSPGSGEEPLRLDSDGVALGLLEPREFRSRIEEGFVEIRPGEKLLLFTDGVVDARNPRGQQFSRRRLLDALRRTPPGRLPGEVLAALFEEISRHVAGIPLYDDMTALLIARESSGVAEG